MTTETNTILRDALYGISREIKCLDHGYVRLIDSLPRIIEHSDRDTLEHRITQAARISFGQGLKSKKQDEELIKYLAENGHSSPFEQISFVYEICCPLYVLGHLVRHRTAKLNVFSFRYAEAEENFYIPEDYRKQSTLNHQSSNQSGLSEDEISQRSQELENHCKSSYQLYKKMLEQGVAREIARSVLPANIYTRLIFQMDLNNLAFKFFPLRCDENCQYETRVFALAMRELIRPLVPITLSILETPRVTLSENEIAIMRGMKTCSERKKKKITQNKELLESWGYQITDLEQETDPEVDSEQTSPEIPSSTSSSSSSSSITTTQERSVQEIMNEFSEDLKRAKTKLNIALNDPEILSQMYKVFKEYYSVNNFTFLDSLMLADYDLTKESSRVYEPNSEITGETLIGIFIKNMMKAHPDIRVARLFIFDDCLKGVEIPRSYAMYLQFFQVVDGKLIYLPIRENQPMESGIPIVDGLISSIDQIFSESVRECAIFMNKFYQSLQKSS